MSSVRARARSMSAPARRWRQHLLTSIVPHPTRADNLYSPIFGVIRMLESMSDQGATRPFNSQCKDLLGDLNLLSLEVGQRSPCLSESGWPFVILTASAFPSAA